ncbi:MAG: hypothetical protein JKP95_02310 [Oceanicaulis sp.]|nr:hypothetical protein [Oceanicaulis sp.]
MCDQPGRSRRRCGRRRRGCRWRDHRQQCGSGNAETGALIGAGVGAAAGAAYGCTRPGGCGHNPNNPNHSELIYDQYSGRSYYTDYRTGDTFWANGEPRTRAPRR